MKNVLALITHGFEEIEAVTPFDLLNRAGIELTIASLGVEAGKPVSGRSNLSLCADTTLEEIAGASENYAALADAYDALLLPGGPSTFALLKDGRAAKLAKAFGERKRLVAAICAAPLILNAAGLLKNKRVSAHACTWEEIPAAKNCARVEIDDNILTSRGAGTAFDFALALVEALAGKSFAAQISADTMT